MICLKKKKMESKSTQETGTTKMTKQTLKQAEATFRNLKKLGEILKINPC